MANAYSIPSNFGQWIDPVNTNLVNTVLGAKQQKYDYNVAKIDAQLEQYTKLPLARDKDKQYLKGRIDSVLKTVNGAGKLNMSDGNVARQIQQSIAGAIDDEVLTQMGNASAINRFEQNVAKKREEKPDLYDDRNYNYAKERAGLQKYLSGETDKIGNLNYQDYYDIDKNLTQEIEKWAAKDGYTRTIKEDGNAYFIRKETNEELTPQAIENYYNTKMQSDPKLGSQMAINSRYEYSGMSDEQFRKGYEQSSIARKQDITVLKAKIEEERKNIPEGDPRLAEYDQAISNANEGISGIDRELASKDFNREQKQMEVYSQSMLNNYKKTYAKKNTISVDYDDTPIKILKFEAEMEKMSREKLKDEKEAMGIGLGTQFTTNDEIQEEKPDAFTMQETAFTESYEALNAQLMATNEKFANGNAEVRKAIRAEAVKAARNTNISAQPEGRTKEYIEAMDNYISNFDTYTKANIEINKKIGTEVQTYFNGMAGSKSNINLNNLASSMPTVAKLLASGSSNYHDLTVREKDMVSLEIANSLKEDIAGDGLDRKFLNNYIKVKEKASGLKYQAPPKEEGFFGSIAGGVGASMRMLWHAVASPISGAASALAMNDVSYKIAQEDGRRGISNAATDLMTNARAFNRNVNSNFQNDRNLSNLQSDEASLEGETVRSRWGAAYKSIEAGVLGSLGEMSSPNKTTTGISYNPAVKEEKAAAQALQSVALARGLNIDSNGAIKIQLSPNKQTAIITADVVNYETSDKGVQRAIKSPSQPIEVPINQLPPEILNNLNSSSSNWNYDYRNPAEFKRQNTHKPFNSSEDRDKFLDKFDRNFQGSFTESEIYQLKSNPSATPLKTEEDYNNILKTKGRIHGLTPQQQEEVRLNVILPQYTVEYQRVKGQGFIAKVLKQEGQKTKEVFTTGMGAINYDPEIFTKESFKFIDLAIQKQIDDYAREYSK